MSYEDDDLEEACDEGYDEDYDDDYDEDYDNDEEEMNKTIGQQCSTPTGVATLEEGRKLVTEFVLGHINSLSWCILMQDGEELKFWPRPNQPCYGEMRTYGAGTIPAKQALVYKPTDLYDSFPDGTPLIVGVPLHGAGAAGIADKQRLELMSLVFDPGLSPWKGVLKSHEILNTDRYSFAGVIFDDLEVDPTLLVNLLMAQRFMGTTRTAARLSALKEEFPDVDPYRLLLFTFLTSAYSKPGQVNLGTEWSYVISPAIDASNFLNGLTDPGVSEGGTFKARFAYNRPNLHDIFGKLGKSFLKRVKEAGIGVDHHSDVAGANTKKLLDLLAA